MRFFFRHGPFVVRGLGEDDDERLEQMGDPLHLRLQEIIGQQLGFEREIVEALEANENVGTRAGEERFFDSSQMYMLVRREQHRYSQAWKDVHYQLKHRRRFFSDSAQRLFNELFEGVENRTSSATAEVDRNVVRNLPEGLELYRARISKSDKDLESWLTEPLGHVGPPPPERATAGRMNPEGTPVFYGSLDWETCLAETRPAIGNDTAVIKLVTTKALRLLDFIRLGDSYIRPSYFQPDFVEQREGGYSLTAYSSSYLSPSC